MINDPFRRLMLGAMLMGLLGCANSTRNQTRLHVQRNAELDRLGQQAGMPEPWMPHDQIAVTAVLVGAQHQREERIDQIRSYGIRASLKE